MKAGAKSHDCYNNSFIMPRNVLLAIIVQIAYVQGWGQVPQSVKHHNSDLQFDTSRIVILEFKRDIPWVFDSSWQATSLTQSELHAVDSLVVVAVTDFNNDQKINNASHPWKIDLKEFNYRTQIIAVTNKKGDRRIWVNSFCSPSHVDWKRSVIFVMDGGTCFFNFKINLRGRIIYDFIVNSLG